MALTSADQITGVENGKVLFTEPAVAEHTAEVDFEQIRMDLEVAENQDEIARQAASTAADNLIKAKALYDAAFALLPK